MRKLSLVVVLLLAPSLAYAWPWSQDMANQISVKPQASVDAANPGMKAFPKRSVPVAGTTVMVKDADAARKMANPVPADDKSVEQGGRLYAIYCTPCHGKSGTGDGLVGEKLIMKPWNLTNSNEMHNWDPKDYPDGFIWGYISLGGAVMPSYANDLSATERWHVVNYMRKVLQKGQAGQAATQATSTGSGQAK
ncbi:MAG: cytochrome c [Nitrosomonadales bacterium]|nr:cytochrome c [Nitrosomonadales bacterium]